MFDLQSFLSGLALGLAGKPLALAREPVAYLHNGVRLPKLPEWDMEKYPKAAIGKAMTLKGMKYHFYVFASQRSSTADGMVYFNLPAMNWVLENDEWANPTEYTESNTTQGSDGTYFGGILYGPYWANYNVLNDDGTLRLAASEPVPVYE